MKSIITVKMKSDTCILYMAFTVITERLFPNFFFLLPN